MVGVIRIFCFDIKTDIADDPLPVFRRVGEKMKQLRFLRNLAKSWREARFFGRWAFSPGRFTETVKIISKLIKIRENFFSFGLTGSGKTVLI